MTEVVAARIGLVVLAAVLVVGCQTDWQHRRIANPLVMAGAAAGLVWQALAPAGAGLLECRQPGALGLANGMAAGLLMLVLGFGLWKLKLFGAGDAKLLAVVAVFLGLRSVPMVLLTTLVAGGVLALASLVFFSLRLHFPAAEERTPNSAPASAGTGFSAYRLPYAFAITLGTLAVVGMSYRDCWPH